MELLAGIFGLALLLWVIALIHWRIEVPKSLPGLGVIASLLAGTIAGYEVFHKDVGPIPITFDRILLGLALAAWLYDRIFLCRDRMAFSGLDGFVGLWFAVILVSTLTSDYGYKDRLPLSRMLFFNLLPLVAYLTLKNGSLKQFDYRLVLWALVCVGVYLGFTGVAEWQHWYSLVYPRYIVSPLQTEFLGRGRGPLLNPVINGMLMSAGGVACLLLLPLTHRLRTRLGLASAFAIISLGVISTLTRSVWIGFAGSVFLIGLAPFSWKSRITISLATAAAGAVFLLVIGPELKRFKRDEFVSAEEMAQSASLRPLLAVVAWQMFQDHPLTGVGFGQYGKFKKPYHQSDRFEMPLQAALPYMQHNVALAYLTELGILGLLTAIGMWSMMARTAWSCWSNSGHSPERRFAALLLATVLLNYMVNGMFHDVSIIPNSNMLLLTMAGLVAATERSSQFSEAPALSNRELLPLAAGPLSA